MDRRDVLFVSALAGFMFLLLGVAYVADKSDHKHELEKLRVVMECNQ